jgi:hypothetical protein
VTVQTPPFTAQLIGRTEKSLNALLARALVGTGLTEPQWVTLSVTVRLTEELDRSSLIDRVAGVFHVPAAEARGHVDALMRLGLVRVDTDTTVRVTDDGQKVFADVSATTRQITERLWGDLPADDLGVAAGVLAAIQLRASVELSGSV